VRFCGPLRAPWLRRLALAVILSVGFQIAAAQPSAEEVSRPPQRLAVVYPEVREPFRSVFRSIVQGVEAEVPMPVTSIEISGDQPAASVAERLREREIRSVILLGKRGLDISAELDPDLHKVVGAVFASPEIIPAGVEAISLAPAPRRLFAFLRDLAPSVEQITVIHGADENRWLIQMGSDAAEELGYRLVAIEVDSIREAANAYRDLLERSRSGKDAIWLLQASSFLDESSVLQMILREAWNRNLIIFSSNPSHVPKGALFSLFPDNEMMGRDLARLAAKNPGAQTTLQPVEALQTAVNVRTADHLGLGLGASARQRFDMVFPNR